MVQSGHLPLSSSLLSSDSAFGEDEHEDDDEDDFRRDSQGSYQAHYGEKLGASDRTQWWRSACTEESSNCEGAIHLSRETTPKVVAKDAAL